MQSQTHSPTPIERYTRLLSAKHEITNSLHLGLGIPAALQRVCGLLVSEQIYDSAWIAVNSETGALLSAEKGLGQAFSHLQSQFLANSFPSCFSIAKGSKTIQEISHPEKSCSNCPLAEKYGERKALTMPLQFQRQNYGVLTLSVPKSSLVQDLEKSILLDIGTEIALALRIHSEKKKFHLFPKLSRKPKGNFDQIFEQNPQAMVVADPEGNILEANAASAAILDFINTAMLKRVNLLLFPPLVNRPFESAWKAVTCEFKDQYVEINYTSFALGKKTLLFHFMPLARIPDEDNRILITIKDISMEKKADELLESATNSLAILKNTKKIFIDTISHEIRTPLNAIIGMADMALLSQSASQQLQYLQTIKEASLQLLHIMNSITDSSLLDTGKVFMEEGQVSLHDLLARLKKDIQQKSKEGKVELTINVDPDVPNTLTLDGNRLYQIIKILSDNALHPERSGKIQLRVQRTNPTDENSPTVSLQFSIRNRSQRITEAESQNIVAMLTQTDASSRIASGSGLRLRIANQVIRQLRGEIHFSSRQESGSEFRFSIEARKGKSSPFTANGLTHTYSLRILLAEDNSFNRLFAATAFTKLGHQVETAKNGEEALEMLAANYYDMVVMDIKMPGMDGIEATRKIRSGYAGVEKQNIPILAMTAHVMPEIQEQAINAGMDGYITKPIDIFDLQNNLFSVLSQARFAK